MSVSHTHSPIHHRHVITNAHIIQEDCKLLSVVLLHSFVSTGLRGMALLLGCKTSPAETYHGLASFDVCLLSFHLSTVSITVTPPHPQMVPVVTLPFVTRNISFGKGSKLGQSSSLPDTLPPCFSGFSSAAEASETVTLLLQPIIDFGQSVVSKVIPLSQAL